jgi:hypothetical protein
MKEKNETTDKSTDEASPATPTQRFVTSGKTIDFPALDWGIHAGETRELPEDEAAQKTILSTTFITLVK